MLDRKFIVENAALVKENCARRNSKADILNDIKTKKALDSDIENRLQAAIAEFKKDFQA